MKISLSDPELVDGLLVFLEQVGVDVAPSEVETFVRLPAVGDAIQARLELELYLRVWEAMHPSTAASVVD